MPPAIRSVLLVLRMVQIYCLVFFFPLFVVGLFTHPAILIGATVHVLVGVAAWWLRKGIATGNRRAARFLLISCIILILILCYAMWSMHKSGEDAAAFIVPAVFIVLAIAVITGLMQIRRIDHWEGTSPGVAGGPSKQTE